MMVRASSRLYQPLWTRSTKSLSQDLLHELELGITPLHVIGIGEEPDDLAHGHGIQPETRVTCGSAEGRRCATSTPRR